MKKRRFWILLSAVAILAMAGVCSVASAAEWPTKPITIIVPHAAGGGTDLIARLVFSYAEKILGQKVIIVNKPGELVKFLVEISCGPRIMILSSPYAAVSNAF